MPHKLAELSQLFNELIAAPGNVYGEFSSIDSPDSYSDQSLIFVNDAGSLPDFKHVAPAALVTDASIASKVSLECPIFVASNVRLAHALIKQHYQDFDASDSEWKSQHPSAVIHPTACLADNVRIGPNAVIGANVEIGNNTVVRAASVIESDAKIGSDCIINSLVNIGQRCIVGNRVIVQAGAIIGNEGFGFAQDNERHYQRVPHTGIVVIEDDVQVGSLCNIDRATYGATVIKQGVKMDALCHVAHNCEIGEDSLLIAQSGTAGSVTLGKRVICSGHTAISDHKSIADDAVLVHRCGVTEDILTSGMWAGTPAKPFKEYVRNLNPMKKIKKLEQELAELKESLSKLSGD